MVEWEIHGLEFANCNCAYGCPCQFNALPTHGDCRASSFVRVDRGHFGDTPLAGFNIGWTVAWPGPIHEGRGVMQPFIDRRADADQAAALLAIMTGQETDPMATFFAMFAAMCERIEPPILTEVSIEVDAAARTARCSAAGIVSSRGEPIRNPVTGREHRVAILLPDGLEFERGECGRGWSTATGAVPLALADSYAHWAELHCNRHGPMR